ncbi:hypothetical protein LguiB_013696 [Lonicera macranthoides]
MDKKNPFIESQMDEGLEEALILALQLSVNGDSDINLIIGLFTARDAQQIIRVPLSITGAADSWVWFEDPKGVYSVRSGVGLSSGLLICNCAYCLLGWLVIFNCFASNRSSLCSGIAFIIVLLFCILLYNQRACLHSKHEQITASRIDLGSLFSSVDQITSMQACYKSQITSLLDLSVVHGLMPEPLDWITCMQGVLTSLQVHGSLMES